MTHAISASGLGKRYGSNWALQNCALEIGDGAIVALVGPNGAGKSTFLQLCAGLLRPTEGRVEIFGHSPSENLPAVLGSVGFVAQERPLYRSFSVSDMLHVGRSLNPVWDQALAEQRLSQLSIPLDRPCGKLSSGQQAQVSLVLAQAKHPKLLLLDEPLASLDPLARTEFLQTLMDGAAADGTTILLSSHIVDELENVCDHLVVLVGSVVRLQGEIEEQLGHHRMVSGPVAKLEALERNHHVIHSQVTERQAIALVRVNGQVLDPDWEIREVTLTEMSIGYFRTTQPAQDQVVQLTQVGG